MGLILADSVHLTMLTCRRCSWKLAALKRTFSSCSVTGSRLIKLNTDKNSLNLAPVNNFSKNQSIRLYTDRPVVNTTLDEEELKNFSKLAQSWWNENGEFAALHTMNRVRVPFIRDGLIHQREELSPNRAYPLQGLKIVDAGSGGGLLTEPLARLGAFVIGVDPVEESTKVAQYHLNEDPELLPRVKYITGTVEDLVGTEAESFDAVVASEVIEHVADYISFTESCCSLIKPGGSIFLTTMNKTEIARGLAVFAAENLFRVVPRGTHDWEKFIPPDDLQSVLERNHFDVRSVHGLRFNPLTLKWSWIQDTSINYAIHAVKLDTTPKEEEAMPFDA